MNRRTALKTAAGFLAGLLAPWRKAPAVELDAQHATWEAVGIDYDGSVVPIDKIIYGNQVRMNWTQGKIWVGGQIVVVDLRKDKAVFDPKTGQWRIVLLEVAE